MPYELLSRHKILVSTKNIDDLYSLNVIMLRQISLIQNFLITIVPSCSMLLYRNKLRKDKEKRY